MLSFFEPEADSWWPAGASPEPSQRHCFSDPRLSKEAYSSAVPALPAADDRRLPSALTTLDLVKDRWFPATRSNNPSSPSSNSTSSSTDSMNSFGGSRILSWLDCNAFPMESPSEPSLAPFLEMMNNGITGERSSVNMAMDTGKRNQHDPMVDWRKQRRSNFFEEESTSDEARDPKRQEMCVNEEKGPWLPSYASASSSILKAPGIKKSQKIREEITALQQLVSPFGKSDTASVLHETTICIKVLHEQIKFLSKPYLESISPQGNEGNSIRSEQAQTTGLRGIGLCMVPISPSIINFADQQPLDHYSRETFAVEKNR